MRPGVRPFVLPAIALVVALVIVQPVGAAPPPSIRLLGTTDQVTVQERSRGGIGIDLGMWIAAVNGDFVIRVSRPDYASDLVATQTTASGDVVRGIPLEDLAGWFGLAGFLHTTVKNANGRTVFRSLNDLCPNGWDMDRVDDSGPVEPSYPQTCWANPFTRSTIWGIDEGWATNASAWLWFPASVLQRGRYLVRVWIDQRYVDLFGIPAEDARASVILVVEAASTSSSSRSATPATAVDQRPLPSVPEIVPTPDTEPDMMALPAWGIYVTHHKRRDYLTFGATVANDGPAPMWVEGFRRSGEDVMDAWQYFTDASGDVVGKAQVGTMEYDARPGHRHWHFEQFADYALLDAAKTQTIMSEKQSFCIGPTDPIDLLAERADWSAPWGSQCGEPGSLWVRETLPVGWGDTYYQWLPGQSFDVTKLPPGKYYLRVQVNPLGELYDANGTDDVSYRLIRLRGKIGGRRWVVVPPYEGVDSEGCWACSVTTAEPRYDGLRRWPPV